MFELAGLSTFLDIFQKAFGLIEKRKDQKRRLFEEIIDPTFKELTVVVGEYHEFFRSCKDGFADTEFKNWQAVLSDRRKKREEIVLARNKVLGMISPFLLGLSGERRSNGKQDELLYKFALGIADFFSASDDRYPGGVTEVTRLFEYIDSIVEQGDETYKWEVIGDIDQVLESLEKQWFLISMAYGELRVYCLT